jgi:hypothetical protein
MPQDDVSVARGADMDIAAEAQHLIWSGSEDAPGILAGVKSKSRTGLVVSCSSSPCPPTGLLAAQLDASVPGC